MKSLKLFLSILTFVAFVGLSTPLHARTHISFNIGGIFPLCAPAPRPTVVHHCPPPCYERVVVYPYGYRETHVHYYTPYPCTSTTYYPSCDYECFGVRYSRCLPHGY